MTLKYHAMQLKADSISETGLFEGYASTFGNVDQGGEVVMPGAFIQGIVQAKKDGRKIRMLREHNRQDVIGVWLDLAEDQKGLYVKGQLVMEVPLAAQTHALMKAGAIDTMSIGYRILPGGAQPDEKRPGVTKLTNVDLREISIVSMPMNTQAKITGVKSLLEAGKLPTVREFESWLRDEGGFSKNLATAIASKAAPHLRGEPVTEAENVAKFLEEMLRK